MTGKNIDTRTPTHRLTVHTLAGPILCPMLEQWLVQTTVRNTTLSDVIKAVRPIKASRQKLHCAAVYSTLQPCDLTQGHNVYQRYDVLV